MALLRTYKDKLEGYKKFYSIVKTIKMVTLAKYRLTMPRAKSRDLSMRYTEKCFKINEYNEDALLEAAKKTQLFIPISTNRGSCGALADRRRLLVMLTLAHLGNKAGFFARALETTQGNVKRLVFFNLNRRHVSILWSNNRAT